MSEYWACKSGVTLLGQVNERWPKRDKASDGWIGDASHQASVSDHNPCWSCTGDRYGVVRARDFDADLGGKGAMDRLAGQLRRYARDRKDDDRLAYIIWDGAIASVTYGWEWRPYSGANDHAHHMHVSFTARGDLRTAKFDLPIFTELERRRLSRLIGRLADRIDTLRRRRARAQRRRKNLGS